MGTGYTRNDSSNNIADGNIINASDFDGEFDAIVSAFSTSGHTHDGTAAEGGSIEKLGPAQQVTVTATAIHPTSADGVSLGSASNEFSDVYLADSSVIYFGADQDTTLTHVADTGILLNSTRKIQFNDASQFIQGSSATVLSLGATDEIDLTATLVDINGNADISGSLTLGGTQITSSATELNILTGTTAASTGVTIATSDKFIINDGGTMKQLTFDDLETWVEANIDAGANLTTVGALDSGSITSGFGNIDNGASNITSGGLLKIDVDADADDLTGDSATGRLTLGAGEDLNLYHGGTNSYIVNDTGDLIIDTAGDVVLDANGADVLLKDDGTQYGALTNSSGDLIIKSGTTTALTMSGADVTIAGDLTISGDDLTMATNTSGMLLVADGTNFNPTAVTALSEISTVANDDVFLAIDTSGGGLKKIARSAVVAGLATSAAISNLVDDDSPQLGADLDTNSFNIAFDDAHGINDDSGNEFIIFQKTATAVNQLDITNAATGNPPEVSATGGDSNISLKLTPKGTGQVVLDGNVGIESGLIDLKNSGSVSSIRFYCESSNAHYAAINAPAHSDFSGNVTLTLPVTTSTLVGDTATQTLTNKTLTSPVLNTGVSGTAVLDEDNLASDSATQLATQQSIKAYVDNSMTSAVTASSTTTLTNKTLTAPKFADAGFIADANGNEQVVFQTTSSAVNALEVTNSATGNAIVVGAFGSDSNVDIDITPKGTGEVNIAAGNLNYAGTAITTTGAEINLIDGDTSRGTTAVASGDGILINDAGTMRMTNVDTVSTYFAGHSVGGTNIVTTGALNAGSITSGFGNIDTGSSTITTTGLISGGSLDIDNVLINGTTIGHTDDTDLMTLANGVLTVAGEVSMTTLDIGGTNVSATAAELNHVAGVTSAIQTQLNATVSTGKSIAMALVFG